ncbi:hypothetical protein F4678DRAFT_348740 [Xylaria arbuscula]|nr:hypothetical protein F4678DRAFT_348740 [Xylaria arbuscula]
MAHCSCALITSFWFLPSFHCIYFAPRVRMQEPLPNPNSNACSLIIAVFTYGLSLCPPEYFTIITSSRSRLE